MISRRAKTLLIVTLLILGIVVGGVTAVLLARFHELDTYKDQILTEIQKSLNRQVTYEKGDATLHFTPAFSFTKVVIKERDGLATFATADRVSFRLALLPLLERKVVIRKLEVERPAVQIIRNRDGIFNISDLLEEKKDAVPLRMRGIRIRDGKITITDQAAAAAGVVTRLEKTDLELDRVTRGRETDFTLATTLVQGTTAGTFSARGSADIPRQGHPMAETRIDAKVEAQNLAADHYWPYYGRYVPFNPLAGHFDVKASLHGTAADFTSKGAIRVAGLRFSYPKVFHAVLSPRDLQLDYTMKRDRHQVDVSAVDFRMDGLVVKGSCAIRDIDTNDPRIVARATMAPFKLERFFHYIPFGIIVDDTSQFIERYIKAGTYRLDEGRLDGRVSQILHMEKDQNYNILTIKARVLEGGVVDLGDGVPPFNSIKGELELYGKNFILRNMSGKFGTSPFTLNGMITDYPLDTPSSYPFNATLNPQQQELAWLLGKHLDGKLSFSGNTTLHITGAGYTSGYALSGDWNLANAGYSATNIIAKPVGVANQLSFKMNLSKSGMDAFSCQYQLPPLALTLSTQYRLGKDVPHHVEIRTNQFEIATLVPLLPRVKPYQPQGRMQVTARADGSAETIGGLNWGGDVLLAGAAFQPPSGIKRVHNINGGIRFRDKSLETPRLSAMLGNSLLFGTGTLTDFDNPAISLEFSAPALDVADLGLQTPDGKSLQIKKVQGTISLAHDTLRIKSLSGTVNESALNLKGTVEKLQNPRVDIAVTSPFLHIEDVLLLTGLERIRKETARDGTATIKASVNAEEGKFEGVQFRKLHTVAMLENRILYLQPFECGAFGGRIAGTLRADFGSNGSPRYQTNLRAEKVSAEELVQALNLRLHDELITGTLTFQADVTAKGKTAAEFKRTILGNIRLHLEDGKLRRYSVLSKIFSILNVSQLFTFKLPDMVADGMPYNRIDGTFALKDGTIATKDLFIDSNAMNVSAVGAIDLVKEEIDAIIGVQPLQTVDKVVNRIPIVGWILTGKDKHLISTYFEAKGKLGDPVVTAVPVKSMAKGVLDIFKRVFQLPGKLITDTGEVIIGK
ncbi:hypothetical protein TFLX_06046 [Thermoflexales bacterium]|nr:hypothetical protein TFLX_06046 [Thermoflexales bacterium]